MTAEEIAEKFKERKPKAFPNRLREKCYREHYHEIRKAVHELEVPLLTAIKIIRESDPEAFPGKSDDAVWQAYNRVFNAKMNDKIGS